MAVTITSPAGSAVLRGDSAAFETVVARRVVVLGDRTQELGDERDGPTDLILTFNLRRHSTFWSDYADALAKAKAATSVTVGSTVYTVLGLVRSRSVLRVGGARVEMVFPLLESGVVMPGGWDAFPADPERASIIIHDCRHNHYVWSAEAVAALITGPNPAINPTDPEYHGSFITAFGSGAFQADISPFPKSSNGFGLTIINSNTALVGYRIGNPTFEAGYEVWNLSTGVVDFTYSYSVSTDASIRAREFARANHVLDDTGTNLYVTRWYEGDGTSKIHKFAAATLTEITTGGYPFTLPISFPFTQGADVSGDGLAYATTGHLLMGGTNRDVAKFNTVTVSLEWVRSQVAPLLFDMAATDESYILGVDEARGVFYSNADRAGEIHKWDLSTGIEVYDAAWPYLDQVSVDAYNSPDFGAFDAAGRMRRDAFIIDADTGDLIVSIEGAAFTVPTWPSGYVRRINPTGNVMWTLTLTECSTTPPCNFFTGMRLDPLRLGNDGLVYGAARGQRDHNWGPDAFHLVWVLRPTDGVIIDRKLLIRQVGGNDFRDLVTLTDFAFTDFWNFGGR